MCVVLYCQSILHCFVLCIRCITCDYTTTINNSMINEPKKVGRIFFYPLNPPHHPGLIPYFQGREHVRTPRNERPGRPRAAKSAAGTN